MPLAVSTPATASDSRVPVYNGVYTLTTAGREGGRLTSFTFKVHTITQARTSDLVGKRVVSRMMDNGGYQAFGFLTLNGELRMWQRFAADENAEYAKACRIILVRLREGPINLLHQSSAWADYTRMFNHRLDFSLLCRVCNGALRSEDDRTSGVHFNGVCTTELSPTQIRDADARAEAEREAERIQARMASQLAEVANLRQSGGGVFPDVPDAIAAHLLRSQVQSWLVR